MPRLIGEILVEKKLITPEELQGAIIEHKKTGEFLGSVLVRREYITEEQLLRSVSEQRNIPFVNLKDTPIDEAAVRSVPVRFVQHYKVMPIRLEGETLEVAVSNPYSMLSLEDLALHLGREVKCLLACQGQILKAIDQYYGVGAETIERIMAQRQDELKGSPGPLSEQTIHEVDQRSHGLVDVEEEAEDIERRADDASVIKLVNQILQEAVRARATDIHIEPDRQEVMLRYRVDGVLYETRVAPEIKYLYPAIVSRIKIMAKLDIAEKRLPKDGRTKVRLGDQDLDLRISILPSVHGETVVIRILPMEMVFSLEKLGLLPEDQRTLETLIRKPHGMILVTGPTGSGKTTTLYTCLSRLNTREKKIVTVEDPAEYELKGITQTQVHPKINVTFANSLRSILRHDPDIIMVGEIRDQETAEIAIQAALTGHLVFSTLHTNDAASGITRLMHMGIPPYLITSSAEAFIAQRLVRLICSACKEEVSESNAERLPQASLTSSYRGKGCEECRFLGYKGRTAIYEILKVDERIKDLILEKVPSDVIKKEAIRLGMKTLHQDGLKKIEAGLTTLEEIMITTQPEG
ncbi:MAG TPA: GspE/PulE family protein [Nitrospiria bacterium]|nr:GspE/PulE family protein [Nitrospiria bacterium]